MLKGISGNKHRLHFVLYDEDERVHLLHSIIDRLPTDVERQFIIDEYTDESGIPTPASAALHQVRVPTVWGELCLASCVGICVG